MASDKGERRQRPVTDEDAKENEKSSRRHKIDPDERDEFDEWRRERGSRGRKRKDKAGGRHRRNRSDDEY